jgi:sucrose-6-phosphate hydrolase SacC (GH32 family)
MSLPRELYLEDEQLRFRPARELDGARGERLASWVIEGSGVIDVRVSAMEESAAEFLVTPVRGLTGVIGARLRGMNCADVELQVRQGHIMVREGNRLLTSEIPVAGAAAPPVPVTGPVSIYYDKGILEVYHPPASPAAVICSRHARYEGLEVDLRPLPGLPQGAVRITGWPSG